MRIVLRLIPLLLLLGGCAETWTCPEGTGRPLLPEGGFAEDCVPLGEVDAGDADTGTSDGGPCPPCSATEPVCDETTGDCVQCTADDESACTGGDRCDTDNHRCIECAGDDECTEFAAARCSDEGRCVGCENAGDCSSVDGDLTACDRTSGDCVRCTPTDADACPTGVCTIDNTCSAYGDTQQLCQRCDTDDNCEEPDWGCAPMEYQMMTVGYCLPVVADPPNCVGPFGDITEPRTSLSGVENTRFCVFDEATLNCEAVNAYLIGQPCPMGDEDCPLPGVCRTVGGTSNRCTFECGNDLQCSPDSPLDGCGDNATGRADWCGGS